MGSSRLIRKPFLEAALPNGRVAGERRRPFPPVAAETGPAIVTGGVFFQTASCALSFRAYIRVDKELELDEGRTSLLLKLLDEYGVRLHVLLAKIVVREDVADELLQELFLKLRRADGFAQSLRPEQYLFRSAINLAFDWRRRGRNCPAPLNGNETCPQPSPVEQAIRREELEQVMSAVERLPPADRELVVMRFLHGSSYDELAVQTGSTPHRMRALCSKAIGRLRKQLDSTQVTEVSDVE